MLNEFRFSHEERILKANRLGERVGFSMAEERQTIDQMLTTPIDDFLNENRSISTFNQLSNGVRRDRLRAPVPFADRIIIGEKIRMMEKRDSCRRQLAQHLGDIRRQHIVFGMDK